MNYEIFTMLSSVVSVVSVVSVKLFDVNEGL